MIWPDQVCSRIVQGVPAEVPILTAMITKNIGMLLLAIYLIAVGNPHSHGLGIGIHHLRAGAVVSHFYPDRA